MNFLFTKIRTYSKLGFFNLLRVFLYKLFRPLGIGNGGKRLNLDTRSFFCAKDFVRITKAEVSKEWTDKGRWFSFHEFGFDGIPDWHANPFQKGVRANDGLPWYKISDFNDKAGDIKTVWDASRFDWVLAMTQRIASGDAKELDRLNNWLEDWIIKNPPYLGVNWKCGQEASIRVMHLAMATLVLEQNQFPSESLKKLIEIHLSRIKPTMGYAIAQCNNHATSEAAALYIGGLFIGGSYGNKLSKKGRITLESQVKRLIQIDGTFSQYSLNYHRVMLDTLCMAEIWRKKNGEPKFGKVFYERAQAASHWLLNMINLDTGDGPNVGANDGARLIQLTNTKYRDFRPTVQLSYALFFNERAIREVGPWDDCLKWLDLEIPQKLTHLENSFLADKGGFAVLRNKQSMVMMRYPRFKFRPSHADALHVDLWVNNLNILRDGGTYSYNTDPKWMNYFSGTESHNTIQFDDLAQMPRISRFLFGDWLKTSKVKKLQDNGESLSFGAGYNLKGVNHFRTITLSANCLRVEDEMKGFEKNAVLRWRLIEGDWKLSILDNTASLQNNRIPSLNFSISTDDRIHSCKLKKGWESKYYLDKNPVPVLEFEILKEGSIFTNIDW